MARARTEPQPHSRAQQDDDSAALCSDELEAAWRIFTPLLHSQREKIKRIKEASFEAFKDKGLTDRKLWDIAFARGAEAVMNLAVTPVKMKEDDELHSA